MGILQSKPRSVHSIKKLAHIFNNFHRMFIFGKLGRQAHVDYLFVIDCKKVEIDSVLIILI